jgi:formate dehydrogenase maturation protein FdhE
MTEANEGDLDHRKVVWGKEDGEQQPAPPCPACGSRGSLVEHTRTTLYFVCSRCQHTWHQSRRQSA